jgi:hypothetical protein
MLRRTISTFSADKDLEYRPWLLVAAAGRLRP